MMRTISMIALAALASLLSGCGCSREKKPVDGVAARMKDAAYINRLAQIHADKVTVASRTAEIKAAIKRLGKDAVRSPEYVDLTNRLAGCKAEAEMLNKAARMMVLDRLRSDSKSKGNLKK